ncbi:hypothetical protein BJF79_41305 [Actinomadura sp. CNU-125]|nr:hypothetical protein BJF79_41305 [Actinomadura sp. CNU-125]
MRGLARGASAVMTGADGGTNTPIVDTWITGPSPAATAPPTTLRVPVTFASTTSTVPPVTPIAAAAWIAASHPSRASATAPASSMSPRTNSTSAAATPSFSRTRVALPGSRTSARGVCPCSNRARTVWDPTNPEAPVMRTRMCTT